MNTKVTPDDVARLTHGRPSRNRVGSSGIWHRLRTDEHEKLAIARRRGFLLANPTTRPALINSWYLTCLADGKRCPVAENCTDGLSLYFIGEGEPAPLNFDNQKLLAEFLSNAREQGNKVAC